jgi:hypothetical protein
MNEMKDAYAQAVEYLTENPGKIWKAWISPIVSPGGCLFFFCGPHATGRAVPWSGFQCGCVTMVHDDDDRVAWTPELTAAIKSDARLPYGNGTDDHITVDHLPILAGWQRRMDVILGRTPPPLDPRLPAPKGDIEIPSIEYGVFGGSICSDAAPADLGEACKQQTPA